MNLIPFIFIHSPFPHLPFPISGFYPPLSHPPTLARRLCRLISSPPFHLLVSLLSFPSLFTFSLSWIFSFFFLDLNNRKKEKKKSLESKGAYIRIYTMSSSYEKVASESDNASTERLLNEESHGFDTSSHRHSNIPIYRRAQSWTIVNAIMLCISVIFFISAYLQSHPSELEMLKRTSFYCKTFS